MNLRALQVLYWGQLVGRLYQYGFGVSTQTWFVADGEAAAERLSLSFRAANAGLQQAFWESHTNETQLQLRALGGRLPPFFQNLLPEGVLRSFANAVPVVPEAGAERRARYGRESYGVVAKTH